MPKIELFNPIKTIAGLVGYVAALGTHTELCLSEHNRGAAPMLDELQGDGE